MLRRWASLVFALDLRSLALFRIGLGLLVFADAVVRSLDIEAFYSDAGVRPRGAVLDTLLARVQPSLHMLSGAVSFQAALFVVAAVAGLLLAVGWRTRTMSVIAWALVLSVQNRNGSINTGADAVLVTFCLFACFLPLGARFSLDARAHPHSAPADHRLCTAATAAVVLQLVVIYVFNVVNKSGQSWFNGTAVLRALHIDQHITPLGLVVREQLAWLSGPLTVGTLVVEASAVLLLLPVAVGGVRSVVVVAMWGLHAGLAACMYLGLFSPVCMVAWLAVIPAAAWRWRPLKALERFVDVGSGAGGPSPRLSIVATVFLGVVVSTQLALNIGKVVGHPMPRPVVLAARAIGVDQLWRMFSENPGRNDGWFVVVGELASGATVDLRGGGPVSFDKPRYVAHQYSTARWRKFMMNNSAPREKGSRRRYAQWLCLSWNRDHAGEDALTAVKLTWMNETTRRDLKPTKVKRDAMGRFVCKVETRKTSAVQR